MVFEAKQLFGLNSWPLHSAFEMKTKSNGKVVERKLCEQNQFQWATVRLLTEEEWSFFTVGSVQSETPNPPNLINVFILSYSPQLIFKT